MPMILLRPYSNTYVSQWYANQNFSRSERLIAGLECRRRSECRTLIRFDIRLPEDAELVHAVLMLHLTDIDGANEMGIGVNRIIGEYDNETVTWNNSPRFVPVSGDFRVTFRDAGRRVEADITELARGWTEGGYPNFGLALTGESHKLGAAVFLSSNNPCDTPRLAIAYHRCHCGPTGPTGTTGPDGATGSDSATAHKEQRDQTELRSPPL